MWYVSHITSNADFNVYFIFEREPLTHAVYTLNFQGDPHLLEDGHGHHH